MQRFNRTQIVLFLRTLDHFLKEDLEVLIVGGAAAILGYDAAVKTSDMDVYNVIWGNPDDLVQARRAAFAATGIDFGVGRTTIADLPYDYEGRTRPLRGVRFKKLRVIVPDKYDLVLSKAARGYAHDLEAIRSMHEHHPLSEKTLAMRFEKDLWKVAMGNPRNLALNMAEVMELLFGKAHGDVYRAKWGLVRS